VFVRVERLLMKLRQPASRADELNALRQRVRDELAADVSDAERALAEDVQAAKLRVSAQLTNVTSCASCAKGDAYDGGACCAGVTANLFDDRELAALVQAGTRLAHLTPPARSDTHAGCAFRGPVGCTLETAHRPARCVHYMCNELRRELHRGGQLDTAEALLADLNAAMQRFGKVHAERVDREVLAPLVAALEAARKC
jgi:hypothetical protein